MNQISIRRWLKKGCRLFYVGDGFIDFSLIKTVAFYWKYVNIFLMNTDVFTIRHGQGGKKGFMEDKSKYFVVKQRAVPEVLLKVVEAKKLLETVRAITVQEAADRVGISRSSFLQI